MSRPVVRRGRSARGGASSSAAAAAAAGGLGVPDPYADPEDAEEHDSDHDGDDSDSHVVGGRKKRGRKVKGGKRKKAKLDGGDADGHAADIWYCRSCTIKNPVHALACGICGAMKPAASKKGVWNCSVCTMENPIASVACEMCGHKLDVTEVKEDEDEDGDVDMVDMTAAPSSAAASSTSTGRKSKSASRRSDASTKLESNPVFLAGVEEAFGRVDIDAHLLTRIAHFIRKPWQLLLTKFHDRDETVLSTHAFQSLQKTLVYDGCQRAMQLANKMADIFRVMEYERLEMLAAQCALCRQRGSHELPLIYSENCFPAGHWADQAKHFVCEPCASKYIMNLVAQKKCDKVLCPQRGCDKEVDMRFLKRCLSAADFSTYSDTCFLISTESSQYQKCPKCSALSEIVHLTSELKLPKGGITITDDAGKVLSEDAWRHYSEFRLRCRECDSNFCTSCRAIPYHLGKTCAEFKEYQGSSHCRFCQEGLEPTTMDASMKNGLLVCKEKACQDLKKTACQHKLACGHACYGIRDEVDHPPCLHEDCQKSDAKFSGGDYCAICYVEALEVAPIVQLTSCQHVFHAHCVEEKIKKGRPGTRITFGYLDCPTCKQRMDHPAKSIQTVLQPALQLLKEVSAKAEARLKIEGMLKDEKLITPTSRYYGHPVQYALDSFAYYNCFKCKKFYFGGRRDCEQNAAAEVREPNEFVCYDCADLKAVNCKFPSHSEFQLWKCRFCCSPAIWFCFGTTHFCDPCHQRPSAVMGRPKASTKQCSGPAHCPLKCAHAPNGPDADCEQNLGCGVCQEKLTKSLEEKKKEEKVNEEIEKSAAAAVGGGGGPGPAPPVKAPSGGQKRGRRH